MHLVGQGEARGLREHRQTDGSQGEVGEAGEAVARGVRSGEGVDQLVRRGTRVQVFG